MILGQFSMPAMTSFKLGPDGGLPNSRMSAPAMKVRPPPINTMASILGSLPKASMPSLMPERTAAASAFTGGLFTVRMPIRPWVERSTASVMAVLP